MKISIIIPAHNEEAYLGKTLESLLNQSYPASQIIVVDDNSTDQTFSIAAKFAETHTSLKVIRKTTGEAHLPGSKVINTFYKGYQELKNQPDIICKFDADLIFPKNYLESLIQVYKKDSKIGMAGGFCYIQKGEQWILENLTNKDHIRGALKSYRFTCFEQIGGLKKAMGWDTIDELLVQYHGWKVQTMDSLKVKHLKPTGITYNKKAKYKQGQAFYQMRYGLILTLIASAKLASKKGKLQYFIDYIKGYLQASSIDKPYLVAEDEGKFIRKLRWKNIKNKIFGKN